MGLSSILIFFLLFPLVSQEQVYFDNGNPPFMYSDNHVAQGIYPEIIREAFSRMQVRVDCVSVPWQRAISEAKKGTRGVGGIYRNKEREGYFDYSDPFFRETIAIYYPVAATPGYASLEDLFGKRVGVILGWSYGEAFDDAVKRGKITAEPNRNDELNFRKLSRGRLDAVVAVTNSGDRLVKELGLKDGVSRNEKLYSLDVFLVFSKNAKRTKLIEAFNAAISGMQTDGTIASIADRENRKQN